MSFEPVGVDVEELDVGKMECLTCDDQITDEAFYVGEFGGHVCEDCVNSYVKECEAEASRFAQENCRITAELPKYNDEDEYRCTPKEYEMGDRESNTPNAYFAKCRHEFTNYDVLINDLHRLSDAICDNVKYEAIRNRIYRILIEEIEKNHPNAVCPWWDEIDLGI